MKKIITLIIAALFISGGLTEYVSIAKEKPDIASSFTFFKNKDKHDRDTLVISERAITVIKIHGHQYLYVNPPIAEYDTAIIHDPNCPLCKEEERNKIKYIIDLLWEKLKNGSKN